MLYRSWTCSGWSELAGTTWAAVLQNYISNANADMHAKMTAVDGKTAVTRNVAVINPDSVARSKSLHFMLTMLLEGPALDIILNSGQGEGYESWQRLVLEYDPRSRVRAAGSMMEVLSHPFTPDSNSFEALDAKVSMHERRTSKADDAAKQLRFQTAGENQTTEHYGEKDGLFTTAGRQSKGFNFQVCNVRFPTVSVCCLTQAGCKLEVKASTAQLRLP